tara:strand:+ start:622 stop:837 length:216 start_codon:yes stop_codon:yes gene_type:complete
MKNSLFERLSKKNQDSFKIINLDLKISQSLAKKALLEKTSWLDLTIMECENICAVLLNKGFCTTSQIAGLF